jgi:hypothetical protein
MHQTTVRFGPDLWAALERECADLGVSVAQFVRESALARLMYVAGRRDDPHYRASLDHAKGDLPPIADGTADHAPPAFQDSAALWAQGRQARRHARELREGIARQRGGT